MEEKDMTRDYEILDERYGEVKDNVAAYPGEEFLKYRSVNMNKDLQILKDRYMKDLLGREFTDEERFEEIKARVIPGQYEDSVRFSNIDYTSVTRNSWDLPGHLYQACDLAVIYARGKFARMDEVKDIFIKAMNEWLKADYVNANWWHNEINVAGTMSDIGLLAWDLFNEKQKRKVHLIIARGSFMYNYGAKEWTGANQLWGTNIAAKHAIIMNDIDYMHEIADRMYEEVVIGMREGIQTDNSYFQHGTRLYAGGYGRNFISSLTSMLGLFDGTPFELPKEKADILSNFILDGDRWMIHKGYFDYIACGREFSRPGWGGAGMISGAARGLCKLNSFRDKVEPLTEFADAVENEKVSVQGVKYFPVAAMMCTHIDDWYIGFKGVRPGATQGEECNMEYIYCANLAYGTTTCVMRSAEEYLTMSPVWNFCRVPGTTTRYEEPDDLSKHSNDCNRFQQGDRFDGGQLGDCAYSAQTVEHHGIRATVVAFGTPWGVAILGSGISSDTDGEELITTVEQCLATGKVNISDHLVEHNGIKYINLDTRNKFITSVEHRTGSWKRNNIPMDDIQSEDDVLEITLDRTHNGYAYLIQPETKDGKFEVLANTEDFQAVRIPDGRVFAHFFKDGAYTYTADGDVVSGKANECVVVEAK